MEFRNTQKKVLMLGDEILLEIDATLDRLIQNAEAIQKVELSDLSEIEIDSFQKTQESLIHHLIHMDECLERKRVGVIDKRSASFKIQEKRTKFEHLKKTVHKNLADISGRHTIVCKRRRKKLLALL